MGGVCFSDGGGFIFKWGGGHPIGGINFDRGVFEKNCRRGGTLWETLADVLEKFRNNSLKSYEVCPGHYSIAPVLCWDAMLNMTKVKLEII